MKINQTLAKALANSINDQLKKDHKLAEKAESAQLQKQAEAMVKVWKETKMGSLLKDPDFNRYYYHYGTISKEEKFWDSTINTYINLNKKLHSYNDRVDEIYNTIILQAADSQDLNALRNSVLKQL